MAWRHSRAAAASQTLPPPGGSHAPRGGPRRPGREAVGPDPQSWEGRGFYVQVERCLGLGEHGMSVRHDEEKYLRHSKAIREGIEHFFDKQLPVLMVDVHTPYAMEVRVMPADCHPRHGQKHMGKEAEAVGARTIFSKIESKKWPKVDAVIQSLMEFCRVPVRIIVLGRSLKGPETSTYQLAGAVNTKAGAVELSNWSSEHRSPLSHVAVQCAHATSGFAPRDYLLTDTEGRAETALFPGNFLLNCETTSNYDRLTPNILTVPPFFEPLEVHVTCSLKKKCTFLVVDHFNRPFHRFPLKLVPRDPAAGLLTYSLRTKLDGKCKGRLGRGMYVAAYDPGSEENAEDHSNWPARPFSQEVEVQDTEFAQSFRIQVHRVRFTVEVMLKTNFGAAPAFVPFSVHRRGPGSQEKFCGKYASTDIGVALFDAQPGTYKLHVEPLDDSPFVQAVTEVSVDENGTFKPVDCHIDTKNVDIKIVLVTPDGQPASFCLFHISPQFARDGRGVEMAFRTNADGVATCTMGLLEPYIFRIKTTGTVMEYMAQEFAFQLDVRQVTIVVARSIFGPIEEDRVVLLIDTSGSMQGYIGDIKIALHTALVQQFHKSTKLFSIATFTDNQSVFRKELVDCSPSNVEEAMKYCDCIEAGGGSGAARAFERVFSFKEMDAAYLITDGKCDVGEALLNRLRAFYFSHPNRPKLHTIGINCVPQRHTWRGLEALAALTGGTFRPVCLQQDECDPVATLAAFRAEGRGNNVCSDIGQSILAGVATTDDEHTEEQEDIDSGIDGTGAGFTSDD